MDCQRLASSAFFTGALQPEWAPLLVILYAGFFIALAQRPMKEQI